jgi:23S rRNA pseudouridine1911/1915/1917 synthase
MPQVKPSSQAEPPFLVYHVPQKWNGGRLASVLKELASESPEFSDQAASTRKPNGGDIPSQGTPAPNTQASWGQVRKWIAQRHIQLNGNLCLDEARPVHAGDVIKLWRYSLPKPPQAQDLRLVYVDEHLCIVEKPAGVTSVRHAREAHLARARRQLQPTLDELVSQSLQLKRGRQPENDHEPNRKPPFRRRPKSSGREFSGRDSTVPPQAAVFPVHRLDHHTSGLMVFARSRPAEQKLIAMFRRHQVRREYVGVCHGQPRPQTIRSFLVRDRGDGLRGSLPQAPSEEQKKSAQEAITHLIGVKPIGSGTYSLFRCRLETGRTHQIRIHLSELGHRLCGEAIYVFDSQGQRLADESQAPRQALHSDRLGLIHPITGETLEFEMPWPRDLANWIQSLST